MSLSELIPDVHGSVQLALDDGGIRCTARSGSGYVPFAAIADVSLARSLLHHTILVLTGTGGEALRLTLASPNGLEVHGAILRHLSERNALAARPATPDALARAGRTLDVWLGDLAGLASPSGGYRSPQFDRTALANTLADVHGEVEARAAAAFVLLTTSDDAELNAVARAFVMLALPPLVLAVARVTPGGGALVDDELFNETKAFLSRADRGALERVAAAADQGCEARIAGALRQAAQEAQAELARQADGATARTHGRRLQHRASSGAGSEGMRWVGRSWSL